MGKAYLAMPRKSNTFNSVQLGGIMSNDEFARRVRYLLWVVTLYVLMWLPGAFSADWYQRYTYQPAYYNFAQPLNNQWDLIDRR